MKKLLLILLLLTTAAHAETYKWIDDGGTVHFADSPGEVPAKYRTRSGSIETDAKRSSDIGLKAGSETGSCPDQRDSANKSEVSPQVNGLQERMMNDEGIMTLIRALQDDPDMRALLGDPALMRAVQSGDIGTLINNPAFLKLLDNPHVREIEKKMNSVGSNK